ncbi:uncharacterized protein LOC111003985 isoform X5 [Pieris rapae]|uniref:uncharacterized protein LOC111003985 isoform X5 n=1 Tax=Pieris rapae TaxID=64459 RepID=UPI001E27FFD4|nr:uncharacterized protein LOC111003985 isoform X5 [Pieris rapae]
MKAAAIYLACTITVALGRNIQLNVNRCPEDYTIEQLYPHEECHKFYQCFHGDLVVHQCAANLYFSIEKQQCDFASTVNCGDRIIPKPDEDDENQPDEDIGDDENTICNCNPSEAPSICAKDGSDGTLIAHENCNKFYECAHGLPITQLCPGKLMYNPYEEICDWPENVDCGDRVISCPEDEDDDGGNGSENEGGDGGDGGNDSENEGGHGGDGGNGGGGDGGQGNCNCNPSEAPSICAKDGSDGTLVAHENCNKFYKCAHGLPVTQLCPGKLMYNPYKEYCDWPENVECGDRVISCPEDEGDNGGNGSENEGGDGGDGGNDSESEGGDGGDGGNGGGSDGDQGNCNCNPSEAPSICAKDGSDGTLVAHENCNKFYKCAHGLPVTQRCPGKLMYNPYKEYCDWPENVECGDRVISCPEDEGDNGGNGSENEGGDGGDGGNDSENEGGDGGDGGNGGGGDGGQGNCNCNPSEAPSICAKDGSDGTLVAHENCNKFYKCAHGLPVTQLCPGKLMYNPYKEYCDWPENVECGDRVISCPEDEGDNGGNGSENEGGDGGDGGNDSENEGGDGGDGGNGGGGDGGQGNCNCNPSEAPSICAKDGSDGTLVAHENCNKFYKCAHGLPVTQLCPGKLMYNPYKEYCDWPENVECGDRVISCPEDEGDNGGNGSENEGGDGGDGGNDSESEGGDGGDGGNGGGSDGDQGNCNCNPSEAPSICAKDGSDGTLVAHENCNKFYKCAHGLPVTQRCPGKLMYNPYKEYCDWPENVECGDRVISCPEDEGDNGGNGSENEGGDGGDGGNDSENEGGDGGDGGNGGGGDGGQGNCNCNPSEAPSICAKDGSDGTLVAHENCNKFYKCAHGLPVTQLCPGKLMYNPYKEYCDWPENVECGDRVISCPEDEGDNGGNGSENEGGDGGDGGNDSENEGGDGGDGGSDGDQGNCNCNPSEAPSICAKDGSDGTLVAHENCNKFYKCAHGLPVTQRCPGKLMYNPYKEYCDWPENVECGDRVISCPEDEGDNGGNGSENEGGDGGDGGNDSENEGGDGGDGGNGGGGDGGQGNCNCNPSEAPSICAKDGSDGTLVAHENCNKFYKCAHGLPVTQLCPGKLMYNPYKEYCDWPENVECGDRVISCPEDEGDNGGNGSENEGGDGGDGGNDSENEGGDGGDGGSDGDQGNCNCNPSEAPSICAKDGSDGTLVAHENCNKFFKCAHGLPVTQRCPGKLMYNPYKEYCDWPENVVCGDRVISCPEDEGDNGGNGSENEGGDGGDGGNDSENEGGDGGDGGNGGGGDGGQGNCNCNPSEAPSICAKDGSDGTLVAHENCNKFYKCAHGLPVTQLCPGKLMYNPYKEYCDWPENVECGDRVISCPEDEGDDGENDSENEGGDGGDGENGGGDGSDSNVDYDPEEAPEKCAENNSEGYLLVHEFCNQFYKCSYGRPVPYICPGNLMYSASKKVCDYPENVKCGNRIVTRS